MKASFGNGVIELARGDITHEDSDAIVNAANTTLLGGGGVDGAIHRAGGPSILAECRKIGGCPTGEARITGGGNLKARHVIHTVGPVYRDGKHGEADLLASAYRASLALAEDKGLASVSFPSISTGAYRYPLDAAAAIAIRTVGGFLRQASGLRRVRFVLFGDAAYEAYARALKKGQAPGRNP